MNRSATCPDSELLLGPAERTPSGDTRRVRRDSESEEEE